MEPLKLGHVFIINIENEPTETIDWQDCTDEPEVVWKRAKNLRLMQLISSGCKMKRMSVRCKCSTTISECTPACGRDAIDVENPTYAT